MIKIKHARTADCVVAGFRWHKNGRNETRGIAAARIVRAKARLHHVGVTSSFTMAARKQLAHELEPLRERALDEHPWREWARAGGEAMARMPGGQSRWSAGKDLSWEPIRVERVCEVKYDHMQGDRFRHAATFLRWRPDKRPDRVHATSSSRSRRLTSSRRSSGPFAFRASGAPIVGSLVRIERLLRGPEVCRHVLQIQPNPRPGAKPAAHRIDEHVFGSQMRRRVRVAGPPALQPCERVRLVLRARRFRSSECFGTRRLDGCTRSGSPGCLR